MALGDSFTEGLEDVLRPDLRHLGWADRVAEALARRQGQVRYANLAVRGRLLDQVLDEQVPRALSMRPGLVSFHAGANDLLRPRADVPGVLDRYRRGVLQLADHGVGLVLFTVIGGSGGSGRTAALLAARFEEFNATVRSVAGQTGAAVADVGSVPALRDRRLWHEDRLHLSPQGHARVGAAVLEALGCDRPELLGGEPGWWTTTLPSAGRSPRLHDLAADARWVRRYFLPWVGRRLRGVSSGDSLPPKHDTFVTLRPAD